MESGRKKYRSTNNLLEDIPSAEAIRARYGLVLPSLVKEPKIRKKKSCQSLDKRVTESINSQTLGDSTHLKTAFKKYDPKKTGTVNEAQFSRAVREAGASLNAQEMDYILTRARRPGSGRVDYKGFVKKVGYRRRARATPEQKAEQARLRRLQIAFSRKADLSGKPLPQLFTSFGHNLDNTISEKDFIKGARTLLNIPAHDISNDDLLALHSQAAAASDGSGVDFVGFSELMAPEQAARSPSRASRSQSADVHYMRLMHARDGTARKRIYKRDVIETINRRYRSVREAYGAQRRDGGVVTIKNVKEMIRETAPSVPDTVLEEIVDELRGPGTGGDSSFVSFGKFKQAFDIMQAPQALGARLEDRKRKPNATIASHRRKEAAELARSQRASSTNSPSSQRSRASPSVFETPRSSTPQPRSTPRRGQPPSVETMRGRSSSPSCFASPRSAAHFTGEKDLSQARRSILDAVGGRGVKIVEQLENLAEHSGGAVGTDDIVRTLRTTGVALPPEELVRVAACAADEGTGTTRPDEFAMRLGLAPPDALGEKKFVPKYLPVQTSHDCAGDLVAGGRGTGGRGTGRNAGKMASDEFTERGRSPVSGSPNHHFRSEGVRTAVDESVRAEAVQPSRSLSPIAARSMGGVLRDLLDESAPAAAAKTPSPQLLRRKNTLFRSSLDFNGSVTAAAAPPHCSRRGRRAPQLGGAVGDEAFSSILQRKLGGAAAPARSGKLINPARNSSQIGGLLAGAP